ncbi:MAG: Na(+)/H(+) antiporter subunit [Devosia sp.]|jgi:multicomponent Na+:H+ antiporter subunit B|nr:Na(+)/H(+) antiporter subunit [Devosia sp.]
MNTVIFRTTAPVVIAIMLVFSVFICLRGHNEPGGGFIGGLIAASAIAIYGMASGVDRVRRAMRVDPLALAGFGVLLAAGTGVLSLFTASPFMTGIWYELNLGESSVALSTPMFFDIGVYFVVFGSVSAIALALEAGREEDL